jgi:hypothetical protein
MLNNEPNSKFFKQYNHISKSQNFKELAMFEHFSKIKDEKLKHKILKKYYRNAVSNEVIVEIRQFSFSLFN